VPCTETLPVHLWRQIETNLDVRTAAASGVIVVLTLGLMMLAEQCHRRHRAIEFRTFLDAIEDAVPAELEIHLILDNYTTHKTPRIQRWLAKRPRSDLHFTPTGASWLNQIERWVALLTQKQFATGRSSQHPGARGGDHAVHCDRQREPEAVRVDEKRG
jgi:transposase